MDSYEEAVLDAEDKMEKCIHHLQDEFSGVRTGKASPNLVENVMVPYYGTLTRLREIAGISTPEARLLVINAFDPTALPAIEKAILAANLELPRKTMAGSFASPFPNLARNGARNWPKLPSGWPRKEGSPSEISAATPMKLSKTSKNRLKSPKTNAIRGWRRSRNRPIASPKKSMNF